MASPRTWIVSLSAKAAFRFEDDQNIAISAAADSTVGVFGVRLRNQTVWSSADRGPDAPRFVGGLTVETARSLATAVGKFGPEALGEAVAH
jgi:hypothetical protein